MELRGQHVVLGLLVLGVGAAGFALWYQRSMTNQALAFWGSDVALALGSPEKLELLTLAPVDPAAGEERLNLGGRDFAVVTRQDITRAPGVTHARQALLENASFDFASPPSATPVTWTHVLLVAQGTTRATIAFDFTGRRVRLEEPAREATLGERLLGDQKSKGLPVFFRDLLGTQAKEQAKPD
jgi:hypothetical protein